MTHGHRLFLRWVHATHLYVTLFGFALLLFFAVTGFMLNHDTWFGLDTPSENKWTVTLPTNLLEKPDVFAVSELLRKEHGARGELEPIAPVAEDDAEFQVVFKAPGRFYEATVRRDDGETTIRTRTSGVIGVLTDLHRGKKIDMPLGGGWGLLIDAVAILFVIVSISGLILWTSLRSRGHYGLLVLMLGLAAGVTVYFVYVPRG